MLGHRIAFGFGRCAVTRVAPRPVILAAASFALLAVALAVPHASRALPLAPPNNDDAATAMPITALPFRAMANTREATSEPGEAAASCAQGASRGVWFRLAPSAPARIGLRASGVQRSVVVSVWLDGVHPLQELTCHEAWGGSSSPDIRLDVVPERPLLVKIETRGLGGDVELVAEALAARPANDHLANAVEVPSLPFSATIGLDGATIEAGEQSPAQCSGGVAGSVWYRYTVPEDQTVVVEATDVDTSVVVSVWQGAGHPLREVRCEMLYSGQAPSSMPRLALIGGATYLFRIERPDTSSAPTQPIRLALRTTTGGARPANDDVASATALDALPFETLLDLAGASVEPLEATSSCGGAPGGSVWYALTPPSDVVVWIEASSPMRGFDVSVWLGGAHPLAEVDCAYGTPLGLPLDGGTAYLVRVAGDTMSGEGAMLRIAPPPPTPTPAPPPANDDLADAREIAALPFVDHVGTAGATGEPGEVSCGGGKSVWYRFAPSASGDYALDTLGSTFDTMLSAWTGSAHPLEIVMCNDDVGDGSGGVWSRLVLSLEAGETYWVAVDGYAGAGGDAVLNVAKSDSDGGPTPGATMPGTATAPTGDATLKPGGPVGPRPSRAYVPFAMAAGPEAGASEPMR